MTYIYHESGDTIPNKLFPGRIGVGIRVIHQVVRMRHVEPAQPVVGNLLKANINLLVSYLVKYTPLENGIS
jgi:hypothetical protein